MNAPTPGPDYTRVSDDASILCKRQDFPRAVNVLQRRAPEHRRWRQAFRRIAGSASGVLDGARQAWMGGALREVVTVVTHPWLRAELAVDLHATAPQWGVREVLPLWTARDVWRLSELEGLPMEYVAQVTALPGAINAPLDTAQLVTDFRRTAQAHRDHAVALTHGLPPSPDATRLSQREWLVRIQVESQTDAARRWRQLAMRLLLGAAVVDDTRG